MNAQQPPGQAGLALAGAPPRYGPVRASVTLPGSKSMTNRALVLAALADGPGAITRPLHARDTLLMARALTALGARIDTDAAPGTWRVAPGRPAVRRPGGRGQRLHGDALRAAGRGADRRHGGVPRGRPGRPAPGRADPGGACASSARSSTTAAAAPSRSPCAGPGRWRAARSPSTRRRPRSSSPACCSPPRASTRAWRSATAARRVPSAPHIAMTVQMLRAAERRGGDRQHAA